MNQFSGFLEMIAWDGIFEHRINLTVDINPDARPYERSDGELMFNLKGRHYDIYEAPTLKIIMVREVRWALN